MAWAESRETPVAANLSRCNRCSSCCSACEGEQNSLSAHLAIHRKQSTEEENFRWPPITPFLRVAKITTMHTSATETRETKWFLSTITWLLAITRILLGHRVSFLPSPFKLSATPSFQPERMKHLNYRLAHLRHYAPMFGVDRSPRSGNLVQIHIL